MDRGSTVFGRALRADTNQRQAGIAAAGGLLAALATTACCIVPLLLFALGIGGAWIGYLTALSPYQPIFAAFALACLAVGYYLVYRNPAPVCAEGQACARPLPRRLVKLVLWAATMLVAAALGFPYAVRMLLGG